MKPLSDALKELSSAEEFFGYFGLNYDPRILAAARLHILKRFHDNLAALAVPDETDAAALHAAYREQLARAYAEFTTGPALTQRVFPRLAAINYTFVPLSSVGGIQKG